MIATAEKLNLMQVACPHGHKLPVWLPEGMAHELYCRRCGRRYSAAERQQNHYGHDYKG